MKPKESLRVDWKGSFEQQGHLQVSEKKHAPTDPWGGQTFRGTGGARKLDEGGRSHPKTDPWRAQVPPPVVYPGEARPKDHVLFAPPSTRRTDRSERTPRPRDPAPFDVNYD